MDRIRIALGKDKLDYLGYSAGSQLGATYATMFPRGGGDHATYLSTKNRCVGTKATAYWLTGELPADGTC